MNQLVRQYFDQHSDDYGPDLDGIPAAWDRLDEQLLDQVDLTDARVLDVGCGDGSFLEYVTAAAPGTTGVGIDISRSMLSGHDAVDDVDLIEASATAIPLRGARFDLINLDDLLHHLVRSTRSRSKRAAAAAVRSVTSLLAPGGHLYVKEQFYEGPYPGSRWSPRFVFSMLRSGGPIARRLDPAAYEGLVVSFYTRDELRQMLESAELEIVETWTRIHQPSTLLRSALIHRAGSYCLLARPNSSRGT